MAHGPAMMATCSPPILAPLGNSTTVPSRAKGAAGQLVRRGDAVHVKHARQQFKLCQVQVGGGSYAGQNGLNVRRWFDEH